MTAMTDQSPLPTRHSVRTLVADLLNRPVDLVDAAALEAAPTNVVAVYVDDKLTLSAAVAVDLGCAARLGGALGMLPPGGVADAIEEGVLPEMMHDCCYEVLNVLAAAFNTPNAPHVRLYELYGPGAKLPGDVSNLVTSFGNRLDVKLSIGGYGDGRMAVVVR